MDLLDLPQLATRAGLPLSLTRYYRDRFILFVPSVRIGRNILHPVEAADVMATIHDHAATGMSADAIQAALEQIYPVTVINSQELPGNIEAIGSLGVIRALAAAVDERGARVEAEVAKLRDQMTETSSVAELQVAVVETQQTQISVASEHAAELQTLRATIEELRSHVALLASREQLEWIGDVVAAAALRPPQGAMDAAIERRLIDLHELVSSRQGASNEVGDVRAAVERLTQQVSGRDQEVHRAFQMLIGAVRKEIAAVHMRLADLRSAVASGGAVRMADDDFARVHVVNGHANGHTAPLIEPGDIELNGDRHSHKSRAPRRLGQPLRVNGAADPEEGHPVS